MSIMKNNQIAFVQRSWSKLKWNILESYLSSGYCSSGFFESHLTELVNVPATIKLMANTAV